MTETRPQTLQSALRPDGDRVAVRFERRYAATPVELWSAVTDPGRVGRWLAPVTLLDERRYRLDFGDDHTTLGEVLACEPPRLLTVSWEFTGEPASRVHVELHPDGAGAVLVLDHTRLPVGQGVGYGAGWQAHLAGMEAQLTGTAAPDWDELFTALLPAYQERLAALHATAS